MTITISEIQDSITELVSSWEEFKDSMQKKMLDLEEKHSMNHELETKMEEIDGKFEAQKSRIDKLEISSQDINLHEVPENIQYKSFKEYVRKGNTSSLEYKSIGNAETLAYLIPDEVSMHIDDRLSKSSVMRKLCSIEKISGDSLEYFTTDNKNTFVGWRGDANVADATLAPQLNRTVIYLHELYSQPQIAKKLLDESLIDLENWLIDHLVDAFSRKENEAFISGDGEEKPSGILSYIDSETQEGAEIMQITCKKLDSDAIIKLYYSLDEYFASRGAFMMHRSVLQEIRSLKSSSGQYLLQPDAYGKEALLGIPVYQTSDMPLATDARLPIIAFADFKSAYKIVENRDMKVLRDPFTNKSFVQFYTTKRVGGGLVNKSALKFLKISAT